MSLPQLFEGLPAGAPHFMEPMKCRLAGDLPASDGWLYEIKFDGYRGIALKRKSAVELISRNKKDLGQKFPEIVQAIRSLKCAQLALDGEIVALDEQGRSGFQLLQRSGEARFGAASLFYYVFDVLNWNGRDTTSLPLVNRKALLKTLLKGAPDCIRFSDFLPGSAEDLTAAIRQTGLEGLIAKRKESTYEAGQRSGAWVKYKAANEQEFVIGGYTNPEGSRPYFGSLIVGYYEKKKLRFAAKVGTGFDAKRLKSLYEKFQKIRIDHCPFANLPERGTGMTAGQMRFCQWVRPELVCQVRFTEWTNDEHLRQPVFLGLREDKSAAEVARELPVP
jgi:bifunctional non-homologous end joining protein LigD